MVIWEIFTWNCKKNNTYSNISKKLEKKLEEKNMKINEIMGLNCAQFKKELKAIEICLNYNFKNRIITYDQLYWELNYVLYGLDIHCNDYCDILEEEGKLIFSEFQNLLIFLICLLLCLQG